MPTIAVIIAVLTAIGKAIPSIAKFCTFLALKFQEWDEAKNQKTALDRRKAKRVAADAAINGVLDAQNSKRSDSEMGGS
jgi:hypothetical protein